MGQDRLAAFGPDPGDVVEPRPGLLPAAQGAVVGDPIAVGLVSDPLHQVECLAAPSQPERVWHLGTIDLFFPFSQSNEGDPFEQAQFLQHFGSHPQLPFAAVDDDQVRGQAPAFLLVLPRGA